MSKSKCRSVVTSEEIYWWLIKRKFELRVHSVDEVLRVDLQDLPSSLRTRTRSQVKLYGWELGHPAMMDDNPEPGEELSSSQNSHG